MCEGRCQVRQSSLGNWIDFLRDSNNKRELFYFLTFEAAKFTYPLGKAVYITSGESVISIGSSNSMPNCNHEEADTRIVVHILHALQQGIKKVKVRTVDTDVVIILTGVFCELVETQLLADIWVSFGIGKNYRFFRINAICASLGPMSMGLPVYHSFTGCDTTSTVKARSQLGRLGRSVKKSQKHLHI